MGSIDSRNLPYDQLDLGLRILKRERLVHCIVGQKHMLDEALLPNPINFNISGTDRNRY